MTTPTDTTTAEPSAFMSGLGHLKVSVEQEGIKLYHEAGQWLDHLSWPQVEHLLVPAIRAVAPGVLSTVGTVAHDVETIAGDIATATGTDQAPAGGFTTLPTDVLEELKSLFGQWFDDGLNKLRAEVGKELDDIRQQLPADGNDAAPADATPSEGSDLTAGTGVDPVVPVGETDATGSAATP